MNHPTDDVLAEFLYDELPAEKQAEIAAHMEGCGQCRGQVAAWRAVRGELDAWAIDEPRAGRSAATPRRAFAILRWAVAAMVLLSAGFVAARLTAPRVDTAALRQEVAQDVRNELRQEMDARFARFIAATDARLDESNQAVERSLGAVDARRAAEIAALRHDLETVAWSTNRQFRQLVSIEPGEQPAPGNQ